MEKIKIGGNNICCLKNKTILFFAPAFFSYEHKIKNELIRVGAKVDYFDERSVRSPFHRALLKVSPYIFKNKTERYYNFIFNIIKKNKYDYVLFIDCEMPTENILKKYRQFFTKAKFCLYLWDSLDNLPGVETKFQYFDYITSFDKKDYFKNSRIKFRPLFFCDEYRNRSLKTEYKYDLAFIGTIHSDRLNIINKIEDQCKNIGLRFYKYCFLQSKFIFYYYKLFNKSFFNAKIENFYFDKKSQKEISEIERNSFIVLDIQHPNQTGLTIRTIENIGIGRKIITTNKDIEHYDFYNKSNIQIIDRINPVIDKNFLNSEYIPLSEEIYQKYSLNQWVLDVLGVC